MNFFDKIPPAAAPAGGILPPVMTPLPLGKVRPAGWLAEQFRLTASGFFSHMDDISYYMSEGNGWLTPDAKKAPDGNPCYAKIAWEEQMYWLRGAYKLVLVTGDERLSRICERYFDAMLASRRPNGYFGPDCLYEIDSASGPVPDVWPHFVAAEILADRYDATGDARVLDLLHGFFIGNVAFEDQVIGIHFPEPIFHKNRIPRIGGIISVHSVFAGLIPVKRPVYFLIDQNQFCPFAGKCQSCRCTDPLRVIYPGDQGHPVL